MSDDSENEDTLQELQDKMPKVPKGMFVSGWDDPDDLIEEDPNPTGEKDL